MNAHRIVRVALCSALAWAAFGVQQAAADVLYDTGLFRYTVFNGTNTYLGFSSGRIAAGSEQRWLAQPFVLPEGTNNITSIRPFGFVPAGFEFTTMHYIIWSREGETAPVDGDQLFSAELTAPAPLPTYADPEDPNTLLGNYEWPLDVDIDLPGGEYYLTVYAGEPAFPDAFVNFAWFANAPGGIFFIDEVGLPGSIVPPPYPYMFRSATFPTPGFGVYQVAVDVYHQDPLGPSADDVNHLYVASFILEGTTVGGGCPNPGCDTGGVDADMDGNCIVNLGDLATLLSNFGISSGATNAQGDTDANGNVNLADLANVLARFGADCN